VAGTDRDTGDSAPLPLLERLGLHRPELRAWAMYEWATTGMWAVIVSTVFPIYFYDVAAASLERADAERVFYLATTVGITLIAVVAPLLGAVTDRTAIKKPMLAAFAALGVAGCGLLFFVQEGNWVLGLFFFVLVNLGANGSVVFYDALLPHIARPGEEDRVSTGAFAIGYLGAGVLLAFCLLMIQRPDLFGLPGGTLPARLSFALVAVWWAVFTIPLLRKVPEPPPEVIADEGEKVAGSTVRFAVNRIRTTLSELRSYRNAFIFLLAYLVYGDGIGTIIRVATIYGASLGIDRGHMIGAIIMVQFIGVPFSFLFGMLAGRIGTKRSLFVGLAVYLGVTVLGFYMTTALHFWMLAVLVGMVQGGTQALSRSLFASMIPAYKSGELFGFYGVMDKFAGMFGPLVMFLVLSMTGSSRLSLLAVAGFFIVGALILSRVDVDEGRRHAREEQARARPLGARGGSTTGA
jgi:MFS transporter, UMF1 family